MQLKDDLEALGHQVFFFGVNREGIFDSEELIKKILLEKDKGQAVYMNFTYINNETGVVWPLELARKIKKATGIIVHVDAVQLVGKIANWNVLDPELDAYTFSGHKFGALKGVGFSFIKKEVMVDPLLVGGNQQQGLRAGTENAIGIYALKLALEEIEDKFSSDELFAAKNIIEKQLLQLIQAKGEVVALKNPNRNLNTIFLLCYGQKAEVLSAKFDMSGVDLSTGSACSSGIIKENRILMSMGYSFEDSRSSLRFSFSPLMDQAEAQKYLAKIESVLRGII